MGRMIVAMAVMPTDAERSRTEVKLEPRLAVLVAAGHSDLGVRRFHLLQIDRHTKVADLADTVVVEQHVPRGQITMYDLNKKKKKRKTVEQSESRNTSRATRYLLLRNVLHAAGNIMGKAGQSPR